MAKLIKLPVSQRIDFLCSIYFTLAPIERDILIKLLTAGNNITKDAVKSLQASSQIKESTWNVSLSRLVKKGVLKRENGAFLVHPVLRNLDSEYLIRFE
jgi:predicted transcriptional regulator